MDRSPESRQIDDVAINDEEHPSRRATLPDQPIVDAITDDAQVARQRPADDVAGKPMDADDQPVS